MKIIVPVYISEDSISFKSSGVFLGRPVWQKVPRYKHKVPPPKQLVVLGTQFKSP